MPSRSGIIGVLTHDGYMEFVVPNCETSVETPDKKEDTHEEEIEKPIVKEMCFARACGMWRIIWT